MILINLSKKIGLLHHIYDDGVEAIPLKIPEARGLGFIVIAYNDADHANNLVTRQSRIGFIVHLNILLIYQVSKKQASV